MNKQRRRDLRDALEQLERASAIVEMSADEEQSAHDNLPDELQWTERGERMEEVASELQEAVELIDQAVEIINGVL